MVKIWSRPSFGLFFGLASANKNGDREEKGSGGLVIGDIALQVGGSLGGVVGIGERFGLYSGLMGAVALIPLLGFGFIGIPIGIHINRKWGLGLIFPIWLGDWWIGLLAGIAAFGVSLLMMSAQHE